VRAATREDVLSYLLDYPRSSTREIAAGINRDPRPTPSQVLVWLRSAETDGLVKRIRAASGPWCWYVPEAKEDTALRLIRKGRQA
jgi:hypothetical protein